MFLHTRILVLAFSLTACVKGGGLFKQDDSNSDISIEGVEADGVISGTISSSSTATQSLNASANSAIKGAGVKFPPGSLSIDGEVSLQEGGTIASSSIASELNINAGSISSAGPSVMISGSKKNAAKAFTLELPKSGSSSLRLGDDNERLIVVYRAWDSDSEQYVTGIFTRNSITISGDTISCKTKLFGAYQAAYSEEVIKKDVKGKAEAPPMTKAAQEKLDPIEWDIGSPTIASDREVTVPIKMRNFAKYGRCTMYVHESKNKAHYFTDSSKDRERLDSLGDAHYKPIKDEEHVAIFRFECTDEKGRYDLSPWSEAITIPEKSDDTDDGDDDDNAGGNTSIFNPNLATPTLSTPQLVTRISVELNWSIASTTDVVAYKIGYAPGSVADCRSGMTMVVPHSGTSAHYKMVRNLIPATAYEFKICALDAAGKHSVGETSIIETTTNTKPGDPDFTCSIAMLDTTCHVSGAVLIADSTIIISGPGNLIVDPSALLDSSNTTRSMVIDMGGDVTINGTISGNVEIYAQNITVGSGSSINASGVGYGGGNAVGIDGIGPGTSWGIAGNSSSKGGSGGAHFGNGGGSFTLAGGVTYVSPATLIPFNMGAGGGAGDYSSAFGGNGGGYIYLTAMNDIDITGHVRANGHDGIVAASICGGGGAGGTVWIEAQNLKNLGGGAATIEAMGGTSPGTSPPSYRGGGGGGGVVFVKVNNCTFSPTGSILTSGGGGYNVGSGGYFNTFGRCPNY